MNDNNNHSNEDFEDIFSNTSSDYEEMLNQYAGSVSDDYEDISSSSNPSEEFSQEDFSVKYNSAANRRKEEYSYNDNDIYSDSGKGGNSGKKGPKSKKKAVKIIALVLAILIVIGSCIGFYAGDTISKLLGAITQGEDISENEYIDKDNLFYDANQVNILLIGVDAREGDTVSRSDTMMLVTVDFVNKQVKLTSFLRDSYVDIAYKNYGMNKLNAAFSYGGAQACIDTLELNFKVEIPYYVKIDFEIFETIVDELGGLDIEITDREARYINSQDQMTEHEKAAFPDKLEGGTYHFDGAQTLWYARIRYLDSDFNRTKRQRKVIMLGAEKARQMKYSEIIKLAEKVLPMVVTNMSKKEMTDLGLKAVKNGIYSWDIVQHQIPADGTWKDSRTSAGAVLEMDLDENARLLREFLANKQSTEDETTTTAS